MIGISDLKEGYQRALGRRDILSEKKKSIEREVVELKRSIRSTEKAQTIIQKVAKDTQQELEYQINEICTLALAAVFENPYEVEIDFVIRRGKTECDIYFVRDGERMRPIPDDASGVGAVDVAAFALRIAMWCISENRTRPLIIMDEPFKHLSVGYRKKASDMVREISEKIGLQIIMVSHDRNFVSAADNVIEIE